MYFWLWITILIGSIVLEALTPSAMICIWFAPAAIIALIMNQLSIAFYLQVLVFFIVTIAFILLIRPIFKEYLRGNTIATNADRVIGKRAKLIKAISEDSFGEVKLNGLIWSTITQDNSLVSEGEMVEILAIDGSKLIVRKI